MAGVGDGQDRDRRDLASGAHGARPSRDDWPAGRAPTPNTVAGVSSRARRASGVGWVGSTGGERRGRGPGGRRRVGPRVRRGSVRLARAGTSRSGAGGACGSATGFGTARMPSGECRSFLGEAYPVSSGPPRPGVVIAARIRRPNAAASLTRVSRGGGPGERRGPSPSARDHSRGGGQVGALVVTSGGDSIMCAKTRRVDGLA